MWVPEEILRQQLRVIFDERFWVQTGSGIVQVRTTRLQTPKLASTKGVERRCLSIDGMCRDIPTLSDSKGFAWPQSKRAQCWEDIMLIVELRLGYNEHGEGAGGGKSGGLHPGDSWWPHKS